MTDSVEVIVEANKTTVNTQLMQLDTLIAPEVVSFNPASAIDSVSSTQTIDIEFNRQMNLASVESAFSIQPEHPVTFSWNEISTTLVATPDVPFEKATTYTIGVSEDAVHAWNVSLEEPLQFEFTTLNRNRLSLVKHFPQTNAIEISTLPQIRLIFDAPLVQSSLIGNVILKDASGNQIPITKSKITEENGLGIYVFETKEPLRENADYELSVMGGVSDIGGNILTDLVQFSFSTIQSPIPNGVTVYDFETESGWKEPEWSGSTEGVEIELTNFEIWKYQKLFGKSSGKLEYNFIGENGLCRLFNDNFANIPQHPETEFGIWIFGDHNKHVLEYWFYNESDENLMVFVDSIDWSGWAYKSISVDDLGVNGEMKFHSIVIRQNPTGSKSGTLYFDNAQWYNSTVSIRKLSEGNIRIYPIPAKEKIVLCGIEEYAGFSMFSITGQPIITKIFNSNINEFSIPITDLKSGFYFVSFYGKDGSVVTKRFVKQ